MVTVAYSFLSDIPYSWLFLYDGNVHINYIIRKLKLRNYSTAIGSTSEYEIFIR